MSRQKSEPTTIVHVEPLFLAKPAAAVFLSLSESTMDALIAANDLPRPRRLSNGRAGWLVEELRAWGLARPVSDLLPPANSGYGRAGKPSPD